MDIPSFFLGAVLSRTLPETLDVFVFGLRVIKNYMFCFLCPSRDKYVVPEYTHHPSVNEIREWENSIYGTLETPAVPYETKDTEQVDEIKKEFSEEKKECTEVGN